MTWESQLPVLFHNGSAESQIDRLLDDAIRAVNEWSQSWEPNCNVFEDEEGFTVQMALPGLEANQIDVQVENDELRVKGERKSDASENRTWHARTIEEGTFACSFQLPAYVDHEKSTATYKHGLLTITFPKREEARPHHIMVECQ